MTDFLEIMWLPFLACLILSGMHAYLGLHVIERGVIFVDLALAQVAAFGATLGFLFGWGLHSTGSYFCSLICTLLGAALLAFSRVREPIVPQEALIGVVYAVAAAAVVIVLSFAPEGGEELKALMVGHILFVDWNEIVRLLLMYSAIGVAHWAFRKQFLKISQEPELAHQEGYNVQAWDFLFYGLFGLVVTSSTELAGVLLVFSFLIVPAICGVLLAYTIRGRLLVGWIIGSLTSVGGIVASYMLDIPTGATVVCVFGAVLLICFLLRAVRKRSEANL